MDDDSRREYDRVKQARWRANNPDKVEAARIAARVQLDDQECEACGVIHHPTTSKQRICGSPDCKVWLRQDNAEKRRRGRLESQKNDGKKHPFRMPYPPKDEFMWCGPCKEEKPIDQFDRSQRNRQIGICNICTSYRKQAHNHGVTVAFIKGLEDEQDGCCRICGLPETKSWRLSLDHDHKHCSGKYGCPVCVRGLLCDAHNRMIGLANDDIAILEAAIEYLKYYKDRDA